MALIHCPECSNEVSDKSNTCPHCGFPIYAGIHNEKKKPDYKLIILCSLLTIIIILLVILLLCIGSVGKKISDISTNDNNDYSITETSSDTTDTDNSETSINEEDTITDPSSPMFGYEKVNSFYWASDDQNVFIQADDIYITQDSDGNYCVVAKLLIAGASEEKALMPIVNIFLCQDGHPYEGITHSGSINSSNEDMEAYSNYMSKYTNEYLYPPDNGYPGTISVYPIANFMNIASYDLEDTFQICVQVVPGEYRSAYTDDQTTRQYMEVDHLEVR